MECREAERLLDPLLDGELGLERSLDVETHLDTCPSCAASYRKLRVLGASLREKLPYEPASAAFEQRLRAARAGAAQPPKRSALRAPSTSRVAWGLLPAAAVLLVIALAFSRLQPGLPASGTVDRIADEALSGHLRSLMASHLADVMSSDQHTVKPWFAGKLDFSPPVVDLATEGFPLAAGRLDYLSGHPVAALIYRRNKHIINLFVWPEAGLIDSQPVSLSRRGYQIVHWTASGMAEWAVSDLNSAELRTFAYDLRRPK